MAFRRIEEIHIGSNPPGMAFGGYVYDIKINFGFNGATTQVTINVVNEDGIYNIDRHRDLSTINPTPIWISDHGDPRGAQRFIELPMMHLIEYTIQKTSDSKILTLEFVDHSLLLDKIWVGLARKSALWHNLLMQPTSINEYSFRERIINMPIKCHPCSKYKERGEHGNIMSVGVREDGKKPELKTYKIPYMAGGGFVSNIHPLMGGALLIGTEEFASDPCRRKDVTYNWRDLVYALNKNNIIIEGIHDRGKPHYRAKHGDRSLKDTINAWCQDLGFDWTWDPMFNGNKIVGRDLTLATAVDLTPIQGVVENWSALSSDKSIITNLNESSSLKNTKVQDHISAYMKPMRVKDYGDTRFKRVFNKNVRLRNVVPESQYGMDRNEKEILISAALAKFSTEARQLYNVLLVHDKFAAEDGWQSNPSLEPLGIESAYKFTEAEGRSLSQLFFSPGNVQPRGGRLGQVGQAHDDTNSTFRKVWDRFDMYLGVFNSVMESDWVSWENRIAEFLGKHYVHKKSHEDFISCLEASDYRLAVTSPNSTPRNIRNLNDFEDIGRLARGAPCASLDDCSLFENSFNLTRRCWGNTVPDEAWKGTAAADKPDWMPGPLNPNNSCCGYISGIPQGVVLERGKTYQFLQTDESWKSRLDSPGWGNTGGLPCMPCGGVGGPGALTGGKLRMVTEGGGVAEGWSYEGVPGRNGIGTYTVPSEGEEAERIYLMQDPNPNVNMGCGPWGGGGRQVADRDQMFAFEDGKNGNGGEFIERFFVLKERADGDLGEEWFQSKREAMWGVTQATVDGVMKDNRKSSLVTKILIEKYKIDGQLKNHIRARFAATHNGRALPDRNQMAAARGDYMRAWYLANPGVNSPVALGNVLSMLLNQGKDAYIIYIPKKTTIENEFTIKNWKTNTKNSRENTYSMDEDDGEVTGCKTICDFTFVDQVCRCWPGADFDIAPEVNGLLSSRANSFTMSVREHHAELDEDGNAMLRPNGRPIIINQWNSAEVIFPSFHDVASYHKYEITYRQVVREITAAAGLITNGGNAMSFNVNRKDITSDVDDVNPDPADPGGVHKPVEGNEGGVGAGLPGWQGGGKAVTSMVVPTVPGLNPTAMGIVPIETYHNEYLKGGNVIRNTWPSQSLDFTVVGGYITPLVPFMSPQYGIETISISYGSQGLQTSFRFATRYPAPIPDQMIHQKIEPQLNINVFGRTS